MQEHKKMSTNAKAMAKTAAENAIARKEHASLVAKVAAFELQKQAEDLLLDIAKDPTAVDFAPISIEDFLTKRDEIVSAGDIGQARLAVKLASRRSFGGGIGDVAEADPERSNLSASGSKADAFLSDFLQETNDEA